MSTAEDYYFYTEATRSEKLIENTDVNTNSTNSTYLGKNQILNYGVFMLIPLIVVIVLGNIMVILLVFIDRRLRSVTNCFLSSLAVADMLVALTVMPPSLAMIVNNYVWPFSDMMCGIWVMLDVFFSTSSILHLCMISCDRYLALAQPFSRKRAPTTSFGGSGKVSCQPLIGHTEAKKWKRVARRILVVWTISLGIAVPIPIVGSINRNNLFVGKMCAINMAEFQLFGSLVAFFLPLTIMFIMYTLTIRTLNRQARLVSSIMVQNSCVSPPSRSSRRHDSTASSRADYEIGSNRETMITSNRNCVACARHEQKIPERAWSKAAPLRRALRRLQILKLFARRTDEEDARNKITTKSTMESNRENLRCTCFNQSFQTENNNHESELEKVRKFQRQTRRSRDNHARVTSAFKNQAMASINNEQRASKVLGLIFVLFCVFWCPFFVTNVTSVLCKTCNQEVMGNLMNWFVWVGYVSSGVNPCVYTMFSKRFRQTFLLFIKCKISTISRNTKKESFSRRNNSIAFGTSRTSVSSETQSSLGSFSQVNDIGRSCLPAPECDKKWRANVEEARNIFQIKDKPSLSKPNWKNTKDRRWSINKRSEMINKITEVENEHEELIKPEMRWN